MDQLDPSVSMERVLGFVLSEEIAVNTAVDSKVKDDENAAYYAGCLDTLEKLKAFITK